MVKRIAVYGSTGSIGTQTLDITAKLGNFEVVSIACNSNTAYAGEADTEVQTEIRAVVEKKGRPGHKLRGSTPRSSAAPRTR